MSNISLLNVENIVSDRFSTLDRTLNIKPDTARSVYFDEKNVAIYPYDPELKKIIKDDMYKEIPMASGQKLNNKSQITKSSAQSSNQAEYTDSFTNLNQKLLLGAVGLFLLRGFLK